MKIPAIRERLVEIAVLQKDLAEETMGLAAELTRRSPKRKAPVKSVPMTPQLAAAIRHTASQMPELSFQQIATFYNVNAGRVSEALSGKRG